MSHPVRIPEHLYEAVRIRAEKEDRSVASMTRVLLTTALATEVAIVPESWPEAPSVPSVPSAAEREYATGDPVEDAPEITPEDVALAEPLFVPATQITRHDTVVTDFKGKKK